MRSLLHELRVTARTLRIRPWYTALIVLTIGLGIGANTAVFSVVDSIILRPPPLAHAERLVDVLDTNRKIQGGGNSLTPQKIIGWQAQPSLFERFESYAPLQIDLTGGSEPERLRGLTVSIGLFSMLGAQPQLGRGFVTGEGRPGSERVVIISEALWRRRFGAQPDVLGQRLTLNDQDYTVIGVMPRRFQLLQDEEALWLPVDLEAHVMNPDYQRGFFGVGRLSGGVAMNAAQALADQIADRLQQETPLPRTWDLRLEKKQVARVEATTQTALFVLLGAVAFVLLITCANVANLFLSQAPARQREMAIRSALGASRVRLIRSVLWESVVLAVMGGAIGVLLATWGVDAVIAAAPERLAFMSTTTIEIDGRILGVAAILTLVTGLLFGLVPAIRGSRPSLEQSLRGSADSGSRASYGRVPGGLVVAEVAFSVILLIGATLMIRTLAKLEAINPGFDPSDLIAMHVDLPTDRYPSPESGAAFFDTLFERLRSVPGISDASVSYGVPPSLGGFTEGQPEAEGSSAAASQSSIIVPFNNVTPGYFRTLRIPIVAGRTFNERETADAVIVSKGFADRFWPDGSAVGRRFRMNVDSTWRTIVGVVGTVEARAGEERTTLQVYYPWVIRSAAAAASGTPPRRRSYDWRLLTVRATDPLAALPHIKQQIRRLDPNQPVEGVALVTDMYAEAFERQRFVLLVLGTFAAIALVLTAAGIFGVLSQVVAQRTREIGIRMALGARPADVLYLFMSRGVRLTAVGTVLGIGGAFLLARVLQNLLFEVGPHDPVTFVAVVTVLISVALAACWLPTRAAMRVQPAIALRSE